MLLSSIIPKESIMRASFFNELLEILFGGFFKSLPIIILWINRHLFSFITELPSTFIDFSQMLYAIKLFVLKLYLSGVLR